MSDVTDQETYYRLIDKYNRLIWERQHLRELARAATDTNSTKKDTRKALDQLVREALEET